jgi:hypothetical protein
MLCERQLMERSSEADAALIRACIVSSRFGDSDGQSHDRPTGLRKHFVDNAALREAAFWAELEFMDEIVAAEDDWHRFYNVEHGGLIGDVTGDDKAWIESAVGDMRQPHRRAVAVHAFVKCWYRRGKVDAELTAICGRLADAPELAAALHQATLPPPHNAQLERMEQQSREHHAAQVEQEANRIEGWKTWREQLLVDPIGAFSPENQARTIRDLHSWLDLISKKQKRFNVWDKATVVQAFGASVADLAEEAFRALWRNTTPELWSARPVAEKNSTPYSWVRGLCGISIEALTPGWAFLLSPQHARTAAAYTAVGLNGFAPFINDLVVAQPIAVDAVIGEELSAELAVGGDHSYLPVLQNLTHSEGGLKRLLAPRLLAALPACPIVIADDIGSRWKRYLGQIFGVLDETSDDAQRRTIALECERRYVADPTGPLALAWLRGLFRFDTERGTNVLTASLITKNSAITQASAISTFAGLFGERDSTLFEIANPDKRARALGQLVRCAYAFIRHKDDRVRNGVYTPDTRDHAERARDFLLSALLDTPGMEAQRIILALAGEKDFAHFPDRLRLRARQRAAQDAEFASYSVGAIVELDSRYEAPPHDRDGLFAVMMDRLEDLAHDVAHHDFTNRRTLRSIEEEVEMQRTLALHLEAHANGAYLVKREDEVADLKRTDLRFFAVRGEQKAVAEVKIADKRWSLSDLERSLRDQLVGQYLRHVACKAGCLLLTYDGKKKYWRHPSSGKRMKFAEMVAYLNQQALSLTAEKCQDIRLAVFGLDLTDPPLVPAHR